MRSSRVSLGDGVHDREPEARPASAPAPIRPREALERVTEELGRKAGALVRDVELDHPVRLQRRQPHVTLAVPERIVDQVAERLLEPDAVALDLPRQSDPLFRKVIPYDASLCAPCGMTGAAIRCIWTSGSASDRLIMAATVSR
jgi:hypothetical protein